MLLFTDFTIENWLTVITVVFAAIGGCFALFRWAENNKIKCAEFYFQVVDKLCYQKETFCKRFYEKYE
ncbi:hypothetical protein FACS189413_02520 [Bacteroidia bacterium]|nr:hypothetical protein FACS189413_02520 [Bacteroidia bacterium]